MAPKYGLLSMERMSLGNMEWFLLYLMISVLGLLIWNLIGHINNS